MGYGKRIWRSLQLAKEASRQGRFDFSGDAPRGPFSAQVDVPGGTLAVCVDDLGPYGLLLRSLELQGRGEGVEPGEFRERLRRGLSQFLGPFEVVEVEPRSSQAQLRSQPPDAPTGGFYEVEVEGARRARLEYYRRVGSGRRQEAVNLAADTLRRLVDSLARVWEVPGEVEG